jgi:multiple sugar transport system substrate-binding protein
MRKLKWLLFLGALVFSANAPAQVKLTFWSHWAAEKIKRDYVEDAIKRFEAANPGVKIEAQWYEKTALYAALKTGLLLDLSAINWSAVEPWAKEIWSYKGKPYGMPLEAATVELYYNKKMLADLGIKVPANLQLDAQGLTDLAKKARAKNITPMSLGVGDRPYPGAYLVHEALLKKLGLKEYDDLLKGKLSWSDPRVLDTLRVVRSWTEAGLLPTTFTTLKLGEAHGYFHTNPGAVTMLVGSWYTSRAFNPTDQGGQPANFPLGIMKFPSVPGAVCNECRTLSVGGSYVANAATKHPKQAIAFLNSFANPEAANRWLEKVLVQTGIKADYAKVSGPHAGYFRELGATSQGAKFYFGQPIQVMQGKPKEVFTQVFNNAFPAGTISVEDAVKQMNAAYGKN